MADRAVSNAVLFWKVFVPVALKVSGLVLIGALSPSPLIAGIAAGSYVAALELFAFACRRDARALPTPK